MARPVLAVIPKRDTALLVRNGTKKAGHISMAHATSFRGWRGGRPLIRCALGFRNRIHTPTRFKIRFGFVNTSGYVPDVPDPPKPAPPPQWEGGSPADEELILKIENWYAETTGFAKSNGTFAELQKRAMNALDKFTTRQLNLINEGLSGQKFTEALRPEAAEMARAKDLLVECISLAREGEWLKDELNTSGLSEGTTTGFRETPFKNILREKLIQGRRTLLRGSINKASGGGGGGTGGGGGGGTEEGGGEGGGSPKTGGNDPAPRGPSIFRRMITLESAATVVETGGYVIFLSQLATTRSSTQAINTTTNFIAASVGATVGGGIFGGVAGYVAPGFVPQAQALGMAAGGYVGSKTTEIVKETDWTDTLKQWAFVGGMGTLLFSLSLACTMHGVISQRKGKGVSTSQLTMIGKLEHDNRHHRPRSS